MKDRSAQTRRRGRGTKNNSSGWRLQPAGMGVGRGTGPLRSAGTGSPGMDTRMKMARPKRFELLTPRFVVWCSIQLSYGRVFAEPFTGQRPARLSKPERIRRERAP